MIFHQSIINRSKGQVLMLLSNAFDPDPRVHQQAKSLIQNGYEVNIICWDRDLKRTAYETIDGIRVERIYIHSTHGRGSSQTLFLFLFWISTFFRVLFRDFDVIHCHDFDTLPLGFLVGKIRGRKIIYDSHESYADMLGDNVFGCIKKGIIFFENYFIKRIDLVITVGETLKKEFINRGAKKSIVVGNWKILEDFTFSKEVISTKRKDLGISNGTAVISFISHLHKERKVPELLEAVKQEKNITLIIGGYGDLAERVKREAQSNKNIIYLEFVDPKNVPLYTCLSDVIFYGFDFNNPNAKYSAPNKLFEALAAGKAIITGNFGEIGKIVREEECGIVLHDYSVKTLKSAFKLLFLNSNLAKYQTNSLQTGKKYNWEEAEAVLIGAYHQLLS